MGISMTKIVTAVIGITVSVIVVATILAPTIAEYTASGEALNEYAGLLGAVLVLTILGVLMIAVRLIGTGKE